ncbi:hypothetical protein FOZ60_003125 [Perkinsus olseni]|uniref:Uncharacterized protein n=1 Tax=Perkinsus olseni TaxID=32597 RepID=A0A7J6NXA1_PEROL|nr:hypothetical protein FOZ60_003125 [Perkinsus olseni]
MGCHSKRSENAEKELRECRARLKRAENEIGSFERWKSDNVNVDRAKLLQQIESLKTQVKVAPNGDVQALATEKEELKVRCSKLEESVTSLSARLREVQIQNDTILKTHVDDLRDERTRQQWYLTGGNPNDEVMKGARELRQLRVKAEVDEKMKEDLRVHATSCKVYVENAQLREHLDAMKARAENYSTQLEREKMARDIAERQLRSNRKEWELNATSDERRKILEKHHEQASAIAHSKYQAAEEKYQSLANIATESIVIGLVRVRLLRGRDGDEATPPEPRIVAVGQDRMLRIYANDLSRPLLQVLKEDLKVMYIGSNSVDIETPVDGLFRFIYPNNNTAQLPPSVVSVDFTSTVDFSSLMAGLEVLGPHSALNVVVLEFLQPIEVIPLAFSSTALLAAVTEVIRAALGSTDCLGTSASQNSKCLAQSFPKWLARRVKRSRLRYGQTAVLLTDGSLYMCGQTPSDASIAGIEAEDPSAWYYRVGRFDKVPLRFKVALVSAGLDFTLLATTEGRVYGQGSNPFGALGIGKQLAWMTASPQSIDTVASTGRDDRLNQSAR